MVISKNDLILRISIEYDNYFMEHVSVISQPYRTNLGLSPEALLLIASRILRTFEKM